MDFSREEVAKVARLARLQLTDVELAEMAGQLGAILEYIKQLEQLDTANVEPLAHCIALENNFRDDHQRPSLPTDQVLANTAKRAGDFFAVPAILD